MSAGDFAENFRSLTGHPPFAWQQRLFVDFLEARVPSMLDLPTGLGKTSVMAIWLLARAKGAPLPRRLVYVVDRRAVVDQASAFAVQLRSRLDGELSKALGVSSSGGLPISTLRGGFADNRAWLSDPTSPAIIVGTVDMIGSRILFEGYGVSRRMRPYQAGLLGIDTLVVLDEAHLCAPFAAMIRSIMENPVFGDVSPTSAVRLLSLSATGRVAEPVFSLTEDEEQDPMVERRLGAVKRLRIENHNKPDPVRIVKRVWELAEQAGKPSRVLVYLDSRRSAAKVRAEIDKLRPTGSAVVTILLVGARRGRERDRVAEQMERAGFLAGGGAGEGHVFLVATSAGEVGVDLDADLMLCDLVPWERMVQRLGRVNRRGHGDAQVIVLDFGNVGVGGRKLPEPERSRLDATRALLQELPTLEEGTFLAGPAAISSLKRDPRAPEKLEAATTPDPLYPALTRATVDAWAMTSLAEHTGRPEVAPWLRGWIDEDPKTKVIWRDVLPVTRKEDGTVAVSQSVADAFFAAAPPHLSEILETESRDVAAWLMARLGSGGARRSSTSGVGREEMPLAPTDIAALLLDGSLVLRQTFSAGSFVRSGSDPKRALEDLVRTIQNGILIVDARVGGLSEGLLDEKGVGPPPTADGDLHWMSERADPQSGEASPPLIRYRVLRRMISEQVALENGWRVARNFDSERDVSGDVTKIIEVRVWRGTGEDEDVRSVAPRPVTLADHTARVERRAREFAGRLGLSEEEIEAMVLAARFHDTGKAAVVWQRTMNAPAGGGPYAKTRGGNGRLLDGYRHEFGSLIEAEKQEFPAVTRDLVLHLIAAHHGNARPIIETSGCAAGPPSKLASRAGDAAQRFARLHHRYGPWGLAWREGILRAADQRASAEEQMDDGGGGK